MQAASNKPVFAALIGGVVSVVVGAAVMLAQGGDAAAPYVAINIAAALAGLVLAACLLLVPAQADRWLAIAAAVALLATALVGVELDGIRRWVRLGPVQLQPAFLLLPLMLCGYARRPADWWRGLAVLLAAAAIAMQPDRSMAAALLAVAALPMVRDRTPAAYAVLICSAAALAITLWRADPLVGVPFVEHVLMDGWRGGLVQGGVLTLAALAMLAPIATLRPAAPGLRRAAIAFGLCWGTLLAASILAPYPTPLIGFGASAIIGYFMSITALRRRQDHIRGAD